MYWAGLLCGVMSILIAPPQANAVPVFGETRNVIQPDGTSVEVRIWGDEYYGITESLDGYSLVRDPQTYFLCYARLSDDANDLVSTRRPCRRRETHRSHAGPASTYQQGSLPGQGPRSPCPLGRPTGQDPRRPQRPARPDHRNVKGICLIVDFADDAGAIPAATVYNYCNQIGYTGYGDNGSVRDYFYDVSDGHLSYTNFVPAAYYRAAHNKTYYTDPSISYGARAVELITEALNALNAQGFNFAQYDADSNGYVDALNCYYAGNCPNNWAEGLWPHSGGIYYCADGVCTQSYQITNMGSTLYLATFCHENGHMLMGWPDLYDYDYDSAGVGQFCIMCYGLTATNPAEPCAYMKYIAGWSTTTLLTSPQINIPVTSTSNVSYKYNNPGHPNEYYLVENRQATGRDSGLPDSGLAIWHIDTQGNNSNHQMTPSQHYLVTPRAGGRPLESRA